MNVLREIPRAEQMKARELYLEAHRTRIAEIYGLPDDRITFDETITELEYRGRPASQACFNYINSDEGITRLSEMRSDAKARLEQSLLKSGDFRHDWNIELDYESLVMDKMIDFDIIPTDLMVARDAVPFFEKNYVSSLMHQGYQLTKGKERHSERSQWFSQWNDKWYAKSALTKYRLVDILQNFSDEWVEDFVQGNKPRHDTLEDIFAKMRTIHRNRLAMKQKHAKRREEFIRKNPKLRNYVEFVVQATDYNEELRSFRSEATWNFVQGCRKEKLRPYEEWLRILNKRKEK